jgi:hypothetical protein
LPHLLLALGDDAEVQHIFRLGGASAPQTANPAAGDVVGGVVGDIALLTMLAAVASWRVFSTGSARARLGLDRQFLEAHFLQENAIVLPAASGICRLLVGSLCR